MSGLSKKVKAFDPLSRYPEVGHGEAEDRTSFQHVKFLQGFINYPGVPGPGKSSAMNRL